MGLTATLIKRLGRVYKRELDPRRAARVYREFDQRRGYGSYHEFCRSRFSRGDAPQAGRALRERGFEYLNVLDAGAARRLLERLRSDHDLAYVKKDTKNLQGFHVTEQSFIDEALAAVLTPAVDAAVAGFFGSEYLVHWVTFSMTPQAPEQRSVSFRWHCDRGPRSHLKLIVYLNASDEHGGNTEFIDLADTARVAERGYLFGWTETRTGEVGHLSRIAGREIHAHHKAMDAGEGVVFQPASVLHRGLSPPLGPRYVMTLCLLPSPVPWQDAMRRGALSDLARDAKWHRHAKQLLRIVQASRG